MGRKPNLLMENHSPISGEGFDRAILGWLQELTPHGICVTDRELRVQGWNVWMETVSGRKRKDVIGHNLLELFPEIEARRLDAYFCRALKGEISLLSAAFHGYLFPFPSQIRDASFTMMLQAARIAPLTQGGQIVGTITTIEDVTHREYQNALLRDEAAKRELSKLILQAEERERQRVARELHDGVNQLLSSSSFRLNAVQQQLLEHDPQLATKIRQASDLVTKAIEEVRLISRNLRPSELDDLGLISALRSLVAEVQDRSGVEVHIEAEPFDSAPGSSIELTIYRIAQEALNNAVKHAAASRIELSLKRNDCGIELHIRDNGSGFEPKNVTTTKQSGWGLSNIRQRAALFQGKVTIDSVSGKGTHIQVRIPLASQ